MILLDTNALLFMGLTPERLSPLAKQTIEEAGPGGLAISAVSAWEIAMLTVKKRITLPTSPREWFRQAIAEYGIRDLALDWASAARAAELPPLHNDPCDRWILGTAITYALPLLTSDTQMGRYGLVPIIW